MTAKIIFFLCLSPHLICSMDQTFKFLKNVALSPLTIMQQVHTSLQGKDRLSTALRKRDLKAIEQYIAENNNINTKIPGFGGNSFHMLACSAYNDNDPYIIQLLVAAGIDYNAFDDKGCTTPLQLAAICGNIKFMSVLLELPRIQIEKSSKDGVTALHLACASTKGSPDMVNLLLKARASYTTIDDDGNTVFHRSADSEEKKRLLLLLFQLPRSNTIHDRKNNWGMTPLHIAVRHGTEYVTQMLLIGRANPNAADNQRITPLHSAAALRLPNILELLLHVGANKDLKNQWGRTALDYAQAWDYFLPKVCNLLTRGTYQSNASRCVELLTNTTQEQECEEK